jgi:hypothetical protein
VIQRRAITCAVVALGEAPNDDVTCAEPDANLSHSRLMAPKNPILVPSLGFRKAVVRHCTDQLREIEGRFERASGPRWEQMLHSCEDLSGVARLVLALQRRIEAFKAADSAWLDELSQLSPGELDERAVEFTRRVKLRLNELHEAIPYPVAPAQFLGAAVLRPGEGVIGAIQGRVIEHDSATGFRVLYTDGDAEDLPLRELQSIMLRVQPDPSAEVRAQAHVPSPLKKVAKMLQ